MKKILKGLICAAFVCLVGYDSIHALPNETIETESKDTLKSKPAEENSLFSSYLWGLNVYTENERYDEAILYFNQSLKKSKVKDNEDSLFASLIYSELGHAYSMENEDDKAVECYNNAIEFCDTNSMAYNRFASHYLKNKDVVNAEKYVKQALDFDNISAINYLTLAEIQFVKNEYNESLETLDKMFCIMDNDLTPKMIKRAREIREKIKKETE